MEWHEAEHIPYWPGGPFIGRQAVLDGVFARIRQDFDNFTVDVQFRPSVGYLALSKRPSRLLVFAPTSARPGLLLGLLAAPMLSVTLDRDPALPLLTAG